MLKIETVLLTLVIINIIASFYLVYKASKKGTPNADSNHSITALDYQEKLVRNMTDAVLTSIKQYNQSVSEQLTIITNSTKENIKDLIESQDKLLKENASILEKTSQTLSAGLEKMQKDNAEKLEKMRETVDEKLNSSLQKRFNESFKLITDRLQEVYQGLGEMRNLAIGVGDLKRVLTNVKTRGVWGEVQLGNMLSQMLAPNQFQENVQIKEHSQERVDYVIKIPSRDGKQVLLPIDAKFP